MSIQFADPEARLRDLASADHRAVDALARKPHRNFNASGLDAETYELVRIAALTATGAPASSWLGNLEAARRKKVGRESILRALIADVLTTIGTPAVSRPGNLEAARDSVRRERIVGTLIAIAPIAGPERTVSAATNIAEALGIG